MLVRPVELRLKAVPLTISVSVPVLPITLPPAARSAASSVNVVSEAEPAFRISTLDSVVLVRLKVVPPISRVSLPELPTTDPPATRSTASTVNVVALLVPAASFSMLVRVVLVRSRAPLPAATVSTPLPPRTLPPAARSLLSRVKTVAASEPCSFSMLVSVVPARFIVEFFVISVSTPVLPMTWSRTSRSAWSTVKVVARLELPCRISTLFRVVLVRLAEVPTTDKVSLPALPATLPPDARSATLTVKKLSEVDPAASFSMLVSVVLVRSMAVSKTVSVSLPLLPTTEPPEARSAASTMKTVAVALPACSFSMLVSAALVRSNAAPLKTMVSLPLLPRMSVTEFMSPVSTVKVVARLDPAFRVSRLSRFVLDRFSDVPLTIRVSAPVLPATVPFAARSAWSTRNVVSEAEPAASFSMLVRVVLVRSIDVSITVSESLPELPTTEPPADRSATSTVKAVPRLEPAFRISMLVRLVLERSATVPLKARVSLPLLPMIEPPETRSSASTVNVVAWLAPAFRISMLSTEVLLRLSAVPLTTSVSTPLLPTIDPPPARSAASTVNSVAVLTPVWIASMLVSVVLVRLMMALLTISVSLPLLPTTLPPMARSAASTVKVVAVLRPAFSASMLVSVVLVRSIAASLTTSASEPLLPRTLPPDARSFWSTVNVVAAPLPAMISTLVRVVLVRLRAVPLTTSLSSPELPVIEPPEARSAGSTVKVVARLEPACRFSTLVRVVLVRLSAVPLMTRLSTPLLPATLPLLARSAWSTVKTVSVPDPAASFSMLVSVVLVRSMAVSVTVSVSLPLPPTTEPPAARSAASTVKTVAVARLACSFSTLVRVVLVRLIAALLIARVSVPVLPVTDPPDSRSAPSTVKVVPRLEPAVMASMLSRTVLVRLSEVPWMISVSLPVLPTMLPPDAMSAWSTVKVVSDDRPALRISTLVRVVDVRSASVVLNTSVSVPVLRL